MAHHQSTIKRIRQDRKKRLANRYYSKTARNAIRDLQLITKKAEAEKALPGIVSMIDKLAKKHRIHKKKASNLKSNLTKHVNALK